MWATIFSHEIVRVSRQDFETFFTLTIALPGNSEIVMHINPERGKNALLAVDSLISNLEMVKMALEARNESE